MVPESNCLRTKGTGVELFNGVVRADKKEIDSGTFYSPFVLLTPLVAFSWLCG